MAGRKLLKGCGITPLYRGDETSGVLNLCDFLNILSGTNPAGFRKS